MEKKQTTAAYKAVAGPDGNRYQFYCDLSGALLCTTGPYRADTAEKELLLAWEKEGKQHFHVCHNCGRYVSDAMYNAEVWECVGCAPYEAEAKFCKSCGVKLDAPGRICPKCGQALMYQGKETAYDGHGKSEIRHLGGVRFRPQCDEENKGLHKVRSNGKRGRFRLPGMW